MLIIGCGDVGRRVAQQAQSTETPVHCVVRSTESLVALRCAGLRADVLDLDDISSDLPELPADREIFYFVPPSPQGREDHRMARFLAMLPAGYMPRIVYISATGVYGDCGGAWVDETRPTDPQVDRAWRRLDAERQLRSWRKAGGGELVILRVAGIYGPGKLPLERLHRQAPMIGADEAPWTNRIHIDDLVQVCAAAMARGRDGEVYNVSDGHPGNMRDYFDRVADLFRLPRAPLIRLDEADGRLSPGLMSYLGESRRLDNRKMLDELGVSLCYATLDKGLASCVPDVDQSSG